MTQWTTASVVIRHAVGLHARPSIKLTKLAKTFVSRIEIAAAPDGPWIDAKSIVRVSAMRAKQDSTLYMRADGGDAAAAVEALKGLVERDFDEDGGPCASRLS
ncbi:MAG: HPr family phosphocarrier protein [Parvibaculaceae bacterium]